MPFNILIDLFKVTEIIFKQIPITYFTAYLINFFRAHFKDYSRKSVSCPWTNLPCVQNRLIIFK